MMKAEKAREYFIRSATKWLNGIRQLYHQQQASSNKQNEQTKKQIYNVADGEGKCALWAQKANEA